MVVLCVGGLASPIHHFFPGSFSLPPRNLNAIKLFCQEKKDVFLIGFSWGAERVIQVAHMPSVLEVHAHSPGRIGELNTNINCSCYLYRTRGDLLCYESTEQLHTRLWMKKVDSRMTTLNSTRFINHQFQNAVPFIKTRLKDVAT